MIDRKYFDYICDIYVHDFDNVKYYYALVDNEGWIAQSGDCPMYHEEADRVYVIRIADHDPEVISHLKTDPSRCIVEPIEVDDPNCPIPYDSNKGVYYGKVTYSPERHLHCARLNKRDELRFKRDEVIQEGFEVEINGEKVKVKYTEHDQRKIHSIINMIRSKRLDNYVLFMNKADKTIPVNINLNNVDELELASIIHVGTIESKLNSTLIPLLDLADTIEEVESITWDMDVEGFKRSKGVITE